MKPTIQCKFKAVIVATLMLFITNSHAQIDYYQDFTADSKWSDRDFKVTDVAACDAGFAMRANPVVLNSDNIAMAETVSPPLGLSNGEQINMAYSYKLLKYNDVLPYQGEDRADWGEVRVDYGTSRNGPWTQIDVINPGNHVASDECALRNVAFTPVDSTQVYVRIRAFKGINPNANYLLYVDNITMLQDNITITPALAQTDLMVYPNPVTDFLTLCYDGIISNVTIFDAQGLEVVVEDVSGDMSRLDFSGLSFGDYVLKVTMGNEIREVNVTKN